MIERLVMLAVVPHRNYGFGTSACWHGQVFKTSGIVSGIMDQILKEKKATAIFHDQIQWALHPMSYARKMPMDWKP